MITPSTEMTYPDRLIIKDTCDKLVRCMSQFEKYTVKELKEDDYMDDFEEYEDFEKTISIPIYSYLNENPLDGLCEVYPNTTSNLSTGHVYSQISLLHNKDDRMSECNTGWGFPLRRFTKRHNIWNAVVACELYYSHFTRSLVRDVLLEEYRKEPLFLKKRKVV